MWKALRKQITGSGEKDSQSESSSSGSSGRSSGSSSGRGSSVSTLRSLQVLQGSVSKLIKSKQEGNQKSKREELLRRRGLQGKSAGAQRLLKKREDQSKPGPSASTQPSNVPRPSQASNAQIPPLNLSPILNKRISVDPLQYHASLGTSSHLNSSRRTAPNDPEGRNKEDQTFETKPLEASPKDDPSNPSGPDHESPQDSSRQHRAASRIQALHRGRQARQSVARTLEERQKAEKEKRTVERESQREKEKEKQNEEKAATAIQSIHRGRQARQSVARTLEERQKAE
eukprot:Cvel_7046.t1-p1 / transcript=Cvel_7046.t1 / gene=Cvel_7046 / organism=Chromera_velia_CCMP2878 / gene_product=hypothetical protein / transcript_product=hypothetical protein / location=Cvel_scaffold360:1-932(-) / protein_length=285 / sequence_SO=supercontig / SO=protein_coding / is_pseudo=false